MADGGETHDLVGVTAFVNGQQYMAYMNKDLANLYQSPDCDPATKTALEEAIIGKDPKLNNFNSPSENENMPSRCSPTPTVCADPSETAGPSYSPQVHIWTISEEKQLIELRLRKEDEFNGSKSHDTLWQGILKEMNASGYHLTKLQIINKWKSLKKKYKEVNDHNAKTGNNRTDWKHSALFDRTYGNKASTKVSVSIDTGRKLEEKDTRGSRKHVAREAGESSKDKALVHDEAKDAGEGHNEEEQVGTATADEEMPKIKAPDCSRKRKVVQSKNGEMFEKLYGQNKKIIEQMEVAHTERMMRMDRMLDLFEKSLENK